MKFLSFKETQKIKIFFFLILEGKVFDLLKNLTILFDNI